MNARSRPALPEAGRKTILRGIVVAAALCAGALASAQSVDWSGRIAVLGSASFPAAGGVAPIDPSIGTPSADQQSLRLMADGLADQAQWSLHVNGSRLGLRGLPFAGVHSSAQFRYRVLGGEQISGAGLARATRLSWEIDRAVYTRRMGAATVAFGRQPVDFGSGRFWQPLNVFGAFAPTELDTDFKPGIDAAVINWYPSDFASLTGVVALAPRNQPQVDDSAALYHRRQLGGQVQMALLAARIVGRTQVGASFESDWRGIGWRIEGLHTASGSGRRGSWFWIAGADYQFDNGAHVGVEWHDDGSGADRLAALGTVALDRLRVDGLRQSLARRVLGLSMRKDLSPLWQASFTLLASALKDASEHRSLSTLQQLSLVYSVSNESDLLFALMVGSGPGLDAALQPRSAYGHLPPSATLRWRMYF